MSNIVTRWAVVVAQLVERSLPTPEVCGSNPVIVTYLYWTFVYCQLYWKDKNKEKRPGMAHFFKKNSVTRLGELFRKVLVTNCQASFWLFSFLKQVSISFFVYFRSFQTNKQYNFATKYCEKCPSSIRCRDSNPRPLEHESFPITTRPSYVGSIKTVDFSRTRAWIASIGRWRACSPLDHHLYPSLS